MMVKVFDLLCSGLLPLTLNGYELMLLSEHINNYNNKENNLEVEDFYDSSLYYKLYDFFIYKMPYGVAKARTGSPDVWILEEVSNLIKKNIDA